ncbi:GreA/GreB family elongation factor [Candidatus Protochlamydia amoebophila]|uniref:Transcription elongation factor GreA n=1 Tax=Candidatus Protochlamydia amoebophila TaxID=362787 RepID=A0A0C1JTD6_9BACT|nr:GreA/GreB family elongation factor [Candidatus Protochlamydia amoebophila]KIC74375.1 Transcription elongation factor GreA [Candidatus Protochlamydia amoebophila]
MGYLKEFLTQINNRDFHKFLVLWEEYCTSDTVDFEEFSQLLKAIKSSDLSKHFGQIIETALPLWKTITDPEQSYEILRLLIDIQTTNHPTLIDLTLETLQKYHGNHPKFQERLKLAGLRDKDQFQGAISKYDLISHLAKGNMVFHHAGWGTGEIMDVSFVREHLVIEFENISGRKDLSFANALKTLVPLSPKHFLARRFADPDSLEKEGRDNPVNLIKLLLHDIGPKTAAEIKDELCVLVIPEKDWTKWWQGARAKIKKDPMIETPDHLREPFLLRKAELSTEERLKNAMHNKTEVDQIIQTTYTFVRDTANALKNTDTKKSLQTKLTDLLELPDLSEVQLLQIHLLLEQFFVNKSSTEEICKLIQSTKKIESLIQDIDIVAFKKRALVYVKEQRSDWPSLFLTLLFELPQAQLRDYLLKELNQGLTTKPALESKLQELIDNPSLSPELFVWYFQKLLSKEENLPFQSKLGLGQFFESFFILFSALENRPEYRDLSKKMYSMLSGKRYALVRELLQGTSLEYTKEILLLASKCQSLTDHDMTILRSLAGVVHPSLASSKPRKGQAKTDDEEIWTTEEGYLKIQDRIRQIGTVEVVENAREIEAARALGDLRENSEFKFAQERRARLQSELKTLSEQFGRARIITPDDILTDEVGIGSVIDLIDSQGQKIRYSILGPWDADPEKNILSLNSKFAQAMIGKKIGDQFQFKDETFKVLSLHSYLRS